MPVPCDHLDLWLGRYRDGELYGRARREAEQHVAECASCRRRITELERLGDALRVGLTDPDRSTGLERELERRIRSAVAEVHAPRPSPLALSWQASAAAALLVLGLGAGLLAMRSSAVDPAAVAFGANPASSAPSSATPRASMPAGSLRVAPMRVAERQPVVVRVLPSGRSASPASVMDTGDADFRVVWIGEREAPP